MIAENKAIRYSIKQLNKLLETYPDEATYTYEFLSYLKTLLKMKSKALPVVEIMTLIKEYKPVIFMKMKQMATKNMMLQILVGSTTDFDTAHHKLQNMLELVGEEPV